MRVCVSARGTDRDAPLDARFGRAERLLLVDVETPRTVLLDASTNAAHGAGVHAANAVVRAGAVAVITGSVGPKAYAVLDGAGIPIYEAEGMSVAEALDLFRRGRLVEIETPHSRAGHRA